MKKVVYQNSLRSHTRCCCQRHLRSAGCDFHLGLLRRPQEQEDSWSSAWGRRLHGNPKPRRRDGGNIGSERLDLGYWYFWPVLMQDLQDFLHECSYQENPPSHSGPLKYDSAGTHPSPEDIRAEFRDIPGAAHTTTHIRLVFCSWERIELIFWLGFD